MCNPFRLLSMIVLVWVSGMTAAEDSHLFGSSAAQPATVLRLARDENCVAGCKAQNRSDVQLCNTLYPPASRSSEHTQCLADARTTFDACMVTCQ